MASTVFAEYYTLTVDARKVSNFATIGMFSSVGVLARWACGAFSSDVLEATVPANMRDPSAVLFHDLLINLLGCWGLGLLSSFQDELQHHLAPLYVGLTTGLCGSATTFSSWMSGMVVLAWDFDEGCILYPVSALLGTVVGFAVPYGFHALGRHMATCFKSWKDQAREGGEGQLLADDARAEGLQHQGPEEADHRAPPPVVLVDGDSTEDHVTDTGVVFSAPTAPTEPPAPRSVSRSVTRFMYEEDATSPRREALAAAGMVCAWLGLAAVYSVSYYVSSRGVCTVCPALWCARGAHSPCPPRLPPDQIRQVMLACTIAPLGAWVRYVLTFNNKHTPTFPVFTYVCNLVGSVVALIIYTLLTKVLPNGEMQALSEAGREELRDWLLALSLGFCGSLTTVSSFVHEVHVLATAGALSSAYVYALTTMVTIHLICVAFLLPFTFHYSECEAGVAVQSVGASS